MSTLFEAGFQPNASAVFQSNPHPAFNSLGDVPNSALRACCVQLGLWYMTSKTLHCGLVSSPSTRHEESDRTNAMPAPLLLRRACRFSLVVPTRESKVGSLLGRWSREVPPRVVHDRATSSTNVEREPDVPVRGFRLVMRATPTNEMTTSLCGRLFTLAFC